MIIRRALSSDAKAIRSLLEQLGYPDFNENDTARRINVHEQEGYYMMVAEVEKQTVGFVSLHWFELAHWHGKLGRITSFCIDEKFRSKGIGRQLLAAAEKILIAQGCEKLEVTSNLRREQAHDFYLKAGYVEDSRRFVKYYKQA